MLVLSTAVQVLALSAAGSALSYSGGGIQWATLHSTRFSVLKRLIDVEGGDVAAQAVLDNVLQGGLQPGKPARRVHEDPTRAGCVTWLQTPRHRIAQVLVLPIAAAQVVAVVVAVAVRGNNYLRRLWETFLLLLLLDMVGFVDNCLLLLHLPPLPPLRLLRLLLLASSLPLGRLTLCSALSSPSIGVITIVSKLTQMFYQQSDQIMANSKITLKFFM